MTDSKMPALIRLYIRSCVIGFAAAAGFVALLIWIDVVGLGTLVSQSDMAFVAVLLLWVFHGIVFAGVQFAYAIMSMAEAADDGHGPGSGEPEPARLPVAIPVRSGAAGRR